MYREVEPIGIHEGVELAEATAYYLRRNTDARNLLAQSNTFPSVEDSDGNAIMHYETMVIRSVESVTGQIGDDGRVRLHSALPINGAVESEALEPIVVTLMDGTEVRGGFIALFQRMNESSEIGTVYFFSDDHSPSCRSQS